MIQEVLLVVGASNDFVAFAFQLRALKFPADVRLLRLHRVEQLHDTAGCDLLECPLAVEVDDRRLQSQVEDAKFVLKSHEIVS